MEVIVITADITSKLSGAPMGVTLIGSVLHGRGRSSRKKEKGNRANGCVYLLINIKLRRTKSLTNKRRKRKKK